jgi:hypothetical protein
MVESVFLTSYLFWKVLVNEEISICSISSQLQSQAVSFLVGDLQVSVPLCHLQCLWRSSHVLGTVVTIQK